MLLDNRPKMNEGQTASSPDAGQPSAIDGIIVQMNKFNETTIIPLSISVTALMLDVENMRKVCTRAHQPVLHCAHRSSARPPTCASWTHLGACTLNRV
jgi:hypothetical protein